MVDKITSHRPNTPNTGKLRSNFKSASSGLRIPQNVSSDTAVVVSANVSRRPEKVASMVDNLKEAVIYSSRALAALKQVGEASEYGDMAGTVKELGSGLDKLREDIAKVFDRLKSRADTAEVLQENISAADSRLSDVDAANAHAEDTGGHIRFDCGKALCAHQNLTADMVATVLDE